MPEFSNNVLPIFLGSTALLMSWLSGKLRPEDKEILEAHEFIQSAISDGDLVSKVELHTGKNLRDQLTPEELEDINEHVKLLRMGNNRN